MSSDSTDPGLLAVADQIAADRPELGAYSKKLSTGFTESALAIRSGIPGLSFSNLRLDGCLPYWHRADDVFENIDADALARTEAFVWELLRRIDSTQSVPALEHSIGRRTSR